MYASETCAKILNLNLDPDIKLSSALQFKPVYKTGDVPLVKVEASTGEIFTTANRIDREKLCSGVFTEKRCFYEIEVAVLPDEIFRLVKIRFLIEDINDNAPLFQSTGYQHLHSRKHSHQQPLPCPFCIWPWYRDQWDSTLRACQGEFNVHLWFIMWHCHLMDP